MVIDRIQRKSYKKTTRRLLSEDANKTVGLLFTTLTAMIVILGGAHFYISSEYQQQRYDLSKIQEEKVELKSLGQALDTKIVETLSFSEIEAKKQVINMVEPEETEFVE